MRHRRSHSRLVPVVLLFMASAAAHAASVTSITLCADVGGDGFVPVDVRETFGAETAIVHAVVLVEGVRAKCTLKGAWICIDGISTPDYEIDHAEVEVQGSRRGRATGHFSLSRPDKGWPPGRYRINVYLDDSLAGVKEFRILAPENADAPAQQAPAQPTPPVPTEPAPPQAAPARLPVTPPAPDQVLRKLEALEAAREAGILTEGEYARKKAALAAELQGPPAVDAETQKRLQALKSAYEAGILTAEEYEQKKTLILAGAGRLQASEQGTAAPPAAPTQPIPAPPSTAGQGRTYSHPAGFSFSYPASWSITDQEGTLQLAPPDAVTTTDGPLELYFLATESLGDQTVREPADESIVQYLDEQLKSLSPALEYTRQSSPIQTRSGKGALLTWQATSPEGRKIVARVYVTFSGQSVVMLVGMGLQERVDARGAELRDMFRSIAGTRAEAASTTPLAVGAPPAPQTQQPAAIPGQNGPTFEEQLKALALARQVGVLSDQEYAAKVKELQDRQLQQTDPQARKKLEALEQAHRAGVIGEAEYNQKKMQLLGASAGGPSAQASQIPAAGVSPKVGGQTYRHVMGFTFWYPGDWTLREHEEMLQLIPPNPSTTADGQPTEIYAVIGDTLEPGMTRPDDPRVVQFMDQAVAQLSPTLKRTTPPTLVPMTAGQGTVMNWEGNSSRGDAISARAYVSLTNDYGVALVALCFKDRLQAREKELQRIFASFAFGQGQRDMQLAGTWSFLTTQSMTNWSPFETSYSRAQMASDHTATLIIQPDGTWSRTDKTQMLAGAGGVWLESNDTQQSNGQWYAGNGTLQLIWEDKSWQEYKYEIRQSAQGTRLLLTNEGKGELWERAQ